MTKPHTISRDELISHMETERWERYASSASKLGYKSLEFSNRRQFKVMANGEPIYFGQSVTDAVNAYNEAG
jgi:hypothetical protein